MLDEWEIVRDQIETVVVEAREAHVEACERAGQLAQVVAHEYRAEQRRVPCHVQRFQMQLRPWIQAVDKFVDVEWLRR